MLQHKIKSTHTNYFVALWNLIWSQRSSYVLCAWIPNATIGENPDLGPVKVIKIQIWFRKKQSFRRKMKGRCNAKLCNWRVSSSGRNSLKQWESITAVKVRTSQIIGRMQAHSGWKVKNHSKQISSSGGQANIYTSMGWRRVRHCFVNHSTQNTLSQNTPRKRTQLH